MQTGMMLYHTIRIYSIAQYPTCLIRLKAGPFWVSSTRTDFYKPSIKLVLEGFKVWDLNLLWLIKDISLDSVRSLPHLSHMSHNKLNPALIGFLTQHPADAKRHPFWDLKHMVLSKSWLKDCHLVFVEFTALCPALITLVIGWYSVFIGLTIHDH